ncbi:FxLYD domain-containing protein [Streptomyces sp. NBC_01794]|nr:FxLYD domain-containing protein [Streptomyces sp. NBC_01750]WSB04960.1 FxLYD domain-containing protein [Streptomyces sp. NBC_01794]WSD30765.1 FxLYD domain-containing protein [Streptomyces sp. NBC_01750]
MAGTRTRGLAGAALTTAVVVAAAGCSDTDSNPSDTVSKAASAIGSVGSDVTAAASSLASRAASALASATAEAQRKLDEVKGGVNAKDAVTLGDPTTDDDGRTTVKVMAKNTTDAAKSFAVQVNFTDKDGKLQDVAVVTVSDVPAGKSKDAVARSTHKLSGDIITKVATALRY